VGIKFCSFGFPYYNKSSRPLEVPSENNQYASTQLFEAIMAELANRNITDDKLSLKSISAYDEFHIRGREVSSELIQQLNLEQSDTLLDVGCGLGGTCRSLSQTYKCNSIGIDLTPEYIRTARLLSQAAGLAEQTSFIQGNALELPFEPNSFEAVISQHVQMNIANKHQFYSEIQRVLKPGGKFIYYDVFSGEKTDLYYPLPWANEAACSFLMSTKDLSEQLKAVGMQEQSRDNQTSKGLAFMTSFMDSARKKDSLLNGQRLLMGPETRTKLENIYKCLSESRVVLQSGVAVKV